MTDIRQVTTPLLDIEEKAEIILGEMREVKDSGPIIKEIEDED